MADVRFRYRRNGSVGRAWSLADIRVIKHEDKFIYLDFSSKAAEVCFNFSRVFSDEIVDVNIKTVKCREEILTHQQLQIIR